MPSDDAAGINAKITVGTTTIASRLKVVCTTASLYISRRHNV